MTNPLGPRVVTAAREWIGTPYHHQASVKGVGADCLGLVRGVLRDVMGVEPEIPPAVFARLGRSRRVRNTARRRGTASEARAADGTGSRATCIVFRLRPRMRRKARGDPGNSADHDPRDGRHCGS